MESEPGKPVAKSPEPPASESELVKEQDTTFPVCPVCGGVLVEIRHKLVCSRCHTICETCCEGGRG
ncbi:MAG: hypothetical protein JSS49_07180 [Planctomycetes bacterium]|nr:hypothetical protein [Planctomycetota bacterium]